MAKHDTLDFGSGDLTRALDADAGDISIIQSPRDVSGQCDPAFQTEEFNEDFLRRRLEGAPEEEESGLFIAPEDIDTILQERRSTPDHYKIPGIQTKKPPLYILGSKRYRELESLESFIRSIISGTYFTDLQLGFNNQEIQKYFENLIAEVEESFDTILLYRAEVLSKNGDEDRIAQLKTNLERKKHSTIDKLILWCSEYNIRVRFYEFKKDPTALNPLELIGLRDEIAQLVTRDDFASNRGAKQIFSREHLDTIEYYLNKSLESHLNKLKNVSQQMLDASLSEVLVLREDVETFMKAGIEKFTPNKLKFLDILIGMLTRKFSIKTMVESAIQGTIDPREYGIEKFKHNFSTYAQVICRSPNLKRELDIPEGKSANELIKEIFEKYELLSPENS